MRIACSRVSRLASALLLTAATLEGCDCAGEGSTSATTTSTATTTAAATLELPTPLHTASAAREHPRAIWISADGSTVYFDTNSAISTDDHNRSEDTYRYDVTTRAISLVPRATRNGGSLADHSVSDDGQRVVLLVLDPVDPADTNGHQDLYLADRTAGTLTRVSVGPDGGQLDQDVYEGVLSGDGHVVAYVAFGAQLPDGSGNRRRELYVRDLTSGTVEHVTAPAPANPDGAVGALLGLASDGSRVAFVANHFVWHEPPVARDALEVDLFERGSAAARFGADVDGVVEASMTGDGRTLLAQRMSDGVSLRIDLDSGTRTEIGGTSTLLSSISSDGHTIVLVEASPGDEEHRSLRILRDGREVSSQRLSDELGDPSADWFDLGVANDGTVVADVTTDDSGGDGERRQCVMIVAPTPVAIACGHPAI